MQLLLDGKPIVAATHDLHLPDPTPGADYVALADEQLAKAKAVLERRTWEARIRREQAEARREAVINTAKARYRSATRTKCRKAAHYPLSRGALQR